MKHMTTMQNFQVMSGKRTRSDNIYQRKWCTEL